MLAYLMLFTALLDAVCSHNACIRLFVYSDLEFHVVVIYTNAFVFVLCLFLVIDIHTSIATLHYLQCS